MPLTVPQQSIVDSPARFRVVVAGRRFGKTHLAIREMARFARIPGRNIYGIYPTYRMAKSITWDNLKYKLQDLNWVTKVNETDLSIVLKNGSKISLRGADNPDSLRGVALDFVTMDEFAFIDGEAWTSVIRPALSDRKGSAMFITTPVGRNWAYDLYMKGLDPTEHQWESFQYTTIEGGNVSEEEIEAARKDLDPRTFRQEYCASFEEYANRIYYAFDRAKSIRQYTEATPLTIHVGLDFNIGMQHAAIFHQQGNTIHAIDEIAMPSSNTQEVVEEIRARYPTSKIFVYPDPSGNARKTSAASGVTDHTILANAGLIVKAPRAHNPVRDGINAVNSKLCSADGTTTFFVDPKCKKILESLEKHTYKEGSNGIPDKDSGYDHMSDAIRYYIDYVFPIRRNVDPELLKPQRWGHALA